MRLGRKKLVKAFIVCAGTKRSKSASGIMTLLLEMAVARSYEPAAASPESSHDSHEMEASAALGGPPDERIAEAAPGEISMGGGGG